MADDGGLYLLQGAFARVDEGGVFREYESPGSQQRRIAALQASADAAYAASLTAVNRRIVQHAFDGALEDLHELVEELAPGELLHAFTDNAYCAAACSGRVLVLEYLRRRGYVVRDVATRGSGRGDVCLSLRTGDGLLAIPTLAGLADRLVAQEADALDDDDGNDASDGDGDDRGAEIAADSPVGGAGGAREMWDAAARALEAFRGALATALQELAAATGMPDASTLVIPPPALVAAPPCAAVATAPVALGGPTAPPVPASVDAGAVDAVAAITSGSSDAADSDGIIQFSAPATLAYLVHVGRLPLAHAADPAGSKIATAICSTRPDGYSPLHLAALLGLPHMVAALIVLGCEVNAVAPDGATPLSCALQGKEEHAPPPVPSAASSAAARGRGGMRGRGGSRGATRGVAAGGPSLPAARGGAGAAAAAVDATGTSRLQLSEATDVVFDDISTTASAASPTPAAAGGRAVAMQAALLQSLRPGSTQQVWGRFSDHARYVICEALLRVAGAEASTSAAMRSPDILAKRRFLWLPPLPPTAASAADSTGRAVAGGDGVPPTASLLPVASAPSAAGAASASRTTTSKRVAVVASSTAKPVDDDAGCGDAPGGPAAIRTDALGVGTGARASATAGGMSAVAPAADSASAGASAKAIVVAGATATSSTGVASSGKTTFSGMFLSREEVWAREMARLQAEAEAATAAAAGSAATATTGSDDKAAAGASAGAHSKP